MSVARSIMELSKKLRPTSDEQGANAAVAVLLKQRKENLTILFVKRVVNSADPWSGQVAFPGGKRSLNDQSLKQTVIRETLEETNINLLSNCRFLGVMTALTSKPKPEIVVLPFVVLLEQEPLIKLNEPELSAFAWVSLEEIVRSKSTVRFDFGEVPAYTIGGMVIWGLTYRIMENLLQALNPV